MTTISNVSTTQNLTLNTVLPTSAQDSESRNLQNQITSAQQRLNKLSSDSEISREEKAKKRQEIQKQIAELNRKLRQRRMEQKEEAAEAAEKQEKQKLLQEAMLSDSASTTTEKEVDNSQKEDKSKPAAPPLRNVLTADSKLQQQQIIESTAREKNGQENVLEAEIKSDTLYGTDTTTKKETLSDMRKEIPWEIEEISQPGTNDFGTPISFTPGINTKIIIQEK